MNRIVVVRLEDSQNGSVHEQFIKGLPAGAHVLFNESVPAENQSDYSFTFDKDNRNWNGPEFGEYNWMFLRQQQNWANDMLKVRGHVFLNEVLSMIGFDPISLGQIVGWAYTVKGSGDPGFVDFGCWAREGEDPEEDGSIKLHFNVQGPIWGELE